MEKHKAICNVDITQINHSRRRKLGINVEQYIICDVLARCQDKVKHVSKNIFKEMLDDYASDKQKNVIELCKKGFIEMYKLSKYQDMIFMRLTDKWGAGKNNGFEELWTLWGKVGNKKQSLVMYHRAIRTGIDNEYLMDKAKYYLKYISATGTFQKHLSSWLNPQYEMYNDKYEIKEHDKKQIPIETIGQSKPSTR